MSPWMLRLDDRRSPDVHMPVDEAAAREAAWSVRWFCWEPAAVSLGLKQPAPAWVAASRAEGLACVERPTGGGLAFHGTDVSIAVVIPQAMEVPLGALMAAVCRSAASLCLSYGLEAWADLDAGAGNARVTYCLAEPSPYAVYAGRRKLAGFALRRYRHSWLVQGSLLVRPIPGELLARMPGPAAAQLAAHAVSLSEAVGAPLSEQDVKRRWAAHWTAWWEAKLMPRLEVAA